MCWRFAAIAQGLLCNKDFSSVTKPSCPTNSAALNLPAHLRAAQHAFSAMATWTESPASLPTSSLQGSIPSQALCDVPSSPPVSSSMVPMLVGSPKGKVCFEITHSPCTIPDPSDETAGIVGCQRESVSRSTSSATTTRKTELNVLVGAAAVGTKLDTPLSWEEDHCYMLECSLKREDNMLMDRTGNSSSQVTSFFSLWSERSRAYGAPLKPGQVSLSTLQPSSSSPSCLVAVEWDEEEVRFHATSLDDNLGEPVCVTQKNRIMWTGTLLRPRSAEVQGFPSVLEEREPQPLLFPIVTLNTPESTVRIVSVLQEW